jgi:two-component system, NtrC family, response regulator PilR
LKDIEYLNQSESNEIISPDASVKPIIYIIDDEDFLRSSLLKFISKIYPNLEVIGFFNPSAFIKELSSKKEVVPFILLTDMSFGDTEIDGIALVDYLKKSIKSNFQVIMMTGFGSIESAINATKKGVFKYITKPFSLEDIREVVGDCLNLFLKINLDKKVEHTQKGQLDSKYRKKTLVEIDDMPSVVTDEILDEMIGATPVMLDLYEKIKKVSLCNSTVLILGESGTGKELVARSIHYMSSRRDAPLVNINCGAIPSDILESELFGHMKGAFTGAVSDRIGKFEASNGGSILLDEIGDMPLLLQVKLLRVLQTKTIEPVGSNICKKIDTRLIAATHKDISSLVKEGKFREDLFYRLNVIPVKIPALKDRRGDVPMLVKFFVKKYTSGNKANLISFTQESFDCLYRYEWPGNVRELENLIERLIILKGGNIIEKCDLPRQMTKYTGPLPSIESPVLPKEGVDIKGHLLKIETSLIRQALVKTNGNKNQASKLLGLNRTTLIEKLKKIDIQETVTR